MTEPTPELRDPNFEEGYIAVLDKPLQWTSADVVRKVKFALRRLGYRRIKVGHAGTLDPPRHGGAAGLHRPRHEDGRRPAGRREGVRRRRDARRHDPQLRPRTPRRPHLPVGAHHARGGRGGAALAHGRTAAGAAPLLGQEGRGNARLRDGPSRRGRSRSARRSSRSTNWSCWRANCPASASACAAARGPTSARWPAKSAKRCRAAATSRRSAARAAAVSRPKKASSLDDFLEKLQKIETKPEFPRI